MKTENKTIDVKMDEIDFSSCKPFPQEFILFVRQLEVMKNWFRAYNKVYDDTLVACNKLDDYFVNCANAISELAACEFVDSYYFSEDKSELVKTIK